MSGLKRILAVLDGTDADAVIVSKAVALAHQQGADLELFLCDAERAYFLLHAYDSTGVEAARRGCIRKARHYLESLRDAVAGAGVPIRVDAVCDSPLFEGIVRKVLRSRCDLVIKNAGSRYPSHRRIWDANDWQLMRACPATLLLSRGKSWQASPRFAAAVDVSSQETAELPEEILRTSRLLADGCHGQLEVLYSEPCAIESTTHQRHVAALQALTDSAGLSGADIRVLSGAAEEALPDFAAGRGYDAFVMGALTHREDLSSQVGTLTAKLVETLDCDFVLVKPTSYQSQIGPGAPMFGEEPEFEAARQPQRDRVPDFVSPWQLPGR